MSGLAAARILEFLANYGERGYAVLRAAVAAKLSSQRGGVRLGDFSYREVAARLKAWGLSYNPSMLLRVLERDYGVIETSYRSSNQHWWRFIDFEAVVEALEAYERGVEGADNAEDDDTSGVDDPEVEVLRAQIASLGLDELVTTLERLAVKPKLTRQDRLTFRRIAFGELELVAKLLQRAEEYPEAFENEIALMKRVLALARRVASKLMAVRAAKLGSLEAERALARSITASQPASGGGEDQPL